MRKAPERGRLDYALKSLGDPPYKVIGGVCSSDAMKERGLAPRDVLRAALRAVLGRPGETLPGEGCERSVPCEHCHRRLAHRARRPGECISC